MRRGYTLVEMMVALAVIAVMAAASVPALGVWLDAEPTAAEAVAALMREARGTALREAAGVTLIIDPETGAWVVDREGVELVTGRLPLEEAALRGNGPRIVVRFGPTGAAADGLVRVTESGRSVRVRADRWTGEVSLDGS